MTYEETRNILTLLKTNYPQSFRGWNKEDAQQFLTLWSDAFKTMPLELVRKAVTSIILEDEREWAPNVGQVNGRIKKLLLPNTEEEAADAWESVRKFIHKYHQDDYYKHYEELSPRIKKILKVYDLKSLANGDSTSMSVERTMFLKRYGNIKEAEEETAITRGNLLAISDVDKVRSLNLPTVSSLIESR